MPKIETPEQLVKRVRQCKNWSDWNKMCDEIKRENNGTYPSFWYKTVITSGLMNEVMGQGADELKVTVIGPGSNTSFQNLVTETLEDTNVHQVPRQKHMRSLAYLQRARHKCVTCGNEIKDAGSFTDGLSWIEYGLSGMCQECQDRVFG